jgi:hypothetical protein
MFSTGSESSTDGNNVMIEPSNVEKKGSGVDRRNLNYASNAMLSFVAHFQLHLLQT